ncbi:MAG TPA: histidine kinase [Aggregatilineales bacterium]|nr:sensor histidine kinase [Anaerolineae bacterium]HUN08957.1 histidine kinase [Aggregatilineales bacterium]
MMDFDTPKDDLNSIIQQEMKQIKDKLFEIKAQIEQTQLLVDREQTRNADIATELRTIQDNLETVPRQDIKNKYDEAIDARFRLTTMRGQLEKFQANREMLEQQQVLLSKVLNGLQGVDSFAAINDIVGGGSGGAARPAVPISIVRIVQSQEEEKMRLARLMHDGPAQSLTNFILQTEICQRLFDRDPARAAEELDNLKSTASVTFQKVRDFIFDLRPMMLDDLGVVPTVRRYVEAFKDKNDIETRLELLGEEMRLESHREVMVFRGIQELMANARDYGQATQILISLDISPDRVKIEVEDNGRGFDANSILEEDPSHLDARAQSTLTLKERYELVGGSLQVTSSETDGTHVSMELPTRD